MIVDKQSLKSMTRVLVLIFSLLAAIMGTSSVAFALPQPCRENATDNKPGSACYESNFQEAKKYAPSLTPQKFEQVVSSCDGTDVIVGLGGGSVTSNSSFSSCSNAVASCLQHEADQSACFDHNVLAMGTNCGTLVPGSSTENIHGDIGAQGNCGWDSRINETNQRMGSDFKTNDDVQNQRIDDLKNKECASAASTSDLANCKKQIDEQAASCYSQLDGKNTPISDAQFSNCITKSSTNAAQCAQRGGNWVGGTDGAQAARCDVPTPQNACQGHGGVNPNDSTKCVDNSPNQDGTAEGVDTNNKITGPDSQCGTVKTNLLACSKDGDAGQTLGNVLKIAVIVLSTIIGIAATGGLAWAAVLYAKAEDNASNVSEAKTLITNIVIGILLYGFMVAIINWLVPGVFGK